MYKIKLYDDFLNEEYKNLDVLNKYSSIALNNLKNWSNNDLKDLKFKSFKEKYDIINNNIQNFFIFISKSANKLEYDIILNEQNILVSMIVNKILRYETDKYQLKKLKKIQDFKLN